MVDISSNPRLAIPQRVAPQQSPSPLHQPFEMVDQDGAAVKVCLDEFESSASWQLA